jgi:hypothetical protein
VLLHLVRAVTEEIPNTIYRGIRTVRYVTSNETSTQNKKPTHSPYDERHVTYGQIQKLHNQPGVTTITTKVAPLFTTLLSINVLIRFVLIPTLFVQLSVFALSRTLSAHNSRRTGVRCLEFHKPLGMRHSQRKVYLSYQGILPCVSQASSTRLSPAKDSVFKYPTFSARRQSISPLRFQHAHARELIERRL